MTDLTAAAHLAHDAAEFLSDVCELLPEGDPARDLADAAWEHANGVASELAARLADDAER